MLGESSNNVQAALAANLRRLRIARYISLSELARVTGISKATLSGIENTHANPTVETLAAIAGALRVTLVELLESMPADASLVARASCSRR
jgi:transcriptional regulator with XRE-family HTH domain